MYHFLGERNMLTPFLSQLFLKSCPFDPSAISFSIILFFFLFNTENPPPPPSLLV